MSELKDQVFQATERGDLEMVTKLVEQFPHLVNEIVNEMDLRNFAARHGQYQILQKIGLPQDKDGILKLIRQASIDGYKETIAVCMCALAKLFDYKNLEAEEYQTVLQIVPERAKGSVYYPYLWDRVKGLLWAYKKGNLSTIPIKKVAKYLF
ncbi:unnamed protein product [Blepharisma stoltei]|uniref:Uncharacterized protein n=1 Tax=Blepharisma stoltei TaxID=1481888 RepID=A0AAU9KAA4_9CILI|nr:unnamed protein product [Blepharisma stoltei]